MNSPTVSFSGVLPRQLKAADIPLSARIFAVVDKRDALRSDRPYRPAWPAGRVRQYINDQAGQRFDPQVVAASLNLQLETWTWLPLVSRACSG